MRYPTRALLRYLREKPPGTDFWLDDLSPKNACQLAIFLHQFMTAIWMDYGKDIVGYQISRPGSDVEPRPCDIRPPRCRACQAEDLPF